MSIKDKLQADLDQARTDLADAQARVDSLTQQIGNIPPEVEAIAEEEITFDEVKKQQDD